MDRAGDPAVADYGGNASELGDARGGYGKSSLFVLMGRPPGMGLPGDRVLCSAKRRTSCSIRCAPDSP